MKRSTAAARLRLELHGKAPLGRKEGTRTEETEKGRTRNEYRNLEGTVEKVSFDLAVFMHLMNISRAPEICRFNAENALVDKTWCMVLLV